MDSEVKRRKPANRRPSRDALQAALAERDLQLAAALERQNATSDILRAIARAPGDADRTLQLIAETSARLFGAPSVSIQIAEDDEFVREYRVGAIGLRVGSAYPRSNIRVGGRNTPGTIVAENQQIHIPDLDHLDPSMADWPGLPHARAGGARSLCGAPLRIEGRAIGALIVMRDRLLPFTADERELLQTFADQGAIAIENARLFNETQEALKQQTATASALQIISRSEIPLHDVMQTLIDSAVKLCADDGVVYLRKGDIFLAEAAVDADEEKIRARNRTPRAIGRDSTTGRVAMSGEVEFIPDVDADAEFKIAPDLRLKGIRSLVGVPLLRDGQVIGVFVLGKTQPGRFGARAVQIARTFADQAVIVIENARLISETQEALKQQTATADVLKVISRSVFDLPRIFETLLSTAVDLVGGVGGAIATRDGDRLRFSAGTSPRGHLAEGFVGHVIDINRATAAGRAVLTGRTEYIPDAGRDPDFHSVASGAWGESYLGVPLSREGQVEGALTIIAERSQAFSARHIELVETFADQAMIAIENARLFEQVQARTRDLSNALERQIATSEILRVISKSPTDARPVFESIVTTAARLLRCDLAFVMLTDGEVWWNAAVASPTGLEPNLLAGRFPVDPAASFPPRAIVAKEVVYLPDWSAIEVPEHQQKVQKAYGINATLHLPLLREGECIGLITLASRRTDPFGQGEVALAESFRDQAMIAIENARMFEQVQLRTRDLQVALDRQTATAEVLKVISRSVADAAPVFETIIESCRRLFGLEAVAVYVVEGDKVRGVAERGWASGDWGRDAQPLEGSTTGRAIAERRAIHFVDLADAPTLPEDKRLEVIKGGGLTVLYVPMFASDRGVGSIVVSRRPKDPFTDAEIAFIQTFADQAAIAIENARLFNETREALERQTATSEVLQVISGSMADAQPVFDKIVVSCRSLFGGEQSLISLLRPDGQIGNVAFDGPNPEAFESINRQFPRPVRDSYQSYAIRKKQVAHYPDILNAPGVPEGLRKSAREIGNYAMLVAPMLWEGESIGTITVLRFPPAAYSEKEISQLKTFADQAVIAIQNAQLFNETKEALEQQTATAGILAAIGRSVSDAQPVFEEILDACQRLFGSEEMGIYTIGDDNMVRVAAWRGETRAEAKLDVTPLEDSVTGRILRERRPHHIPDMRTDPNISAKIRERAERLGSASLLHAPMLLEEGGLGSILVVRSPPKPFTDREIGLLQTFADQAAIAIQNTRLFNETQEALTQQTATADVLKVISRSVFDLETVLQTLIDTAVRLTRGSRGTIFIRRGDQLVARAFHSQVPEALRAYLTSESWPLDGDTHMARSAREGRVVHIADLSLSDKQSDQEVKRRAAFGAGLWTPLMRDGEAIGVLGVPREEAVPFSAREIELIQTFADQAVIAIENSRLFEEVRAKTRDLEQALERQQATAEILRVISSSPTDVKPVFDVIVATATRLIGCEFSMVFRLEQGGLVPVSGTDRLGNPRLGRPVPIDAESNFPSRAVGNKKTYYVPDFDDIDIPDFERVVRRELGVASAVYLPFMRGEDCLGLLILVGREAHAFGSSEIALAESFRDQAMIAIENTRLFNETQEALERQQASAEILRVISSSPTDVKPVFDAIVSTAIRLIGCDFGNVFRVEAAGLRPVSRAVRSGLAPVGPLVPIAPEDNLPSRAVVERRTLYVPDYADVEISELDREVVRQLGIASAVFLPFMRGDECLGLLALGDRRTHAFGPGEIALAESFRDQALIAIENTRLFNETQEALQQQTATADVLKVISRSAFELQPVLDALIGSAVALLGAANGTMCLRDGDVFRFRAHSGVAPEFVTWLQENPPHADLKSASGRVIVSRKVVQISDVTSDPNYFMPTNALNQTRSILGAPMLRNDVVEGVLIIARTEPGDFTRRQIELVETFADQAVIAIENARLFEEVQARTRDLAEALQQQTATADVLKVISRSAFELQPVLDTLISSAVQLIGGAYGGIFVREGEEYPYRGFYSAKPELIDWLRQNPPRPGRGRIGGRVLLTGETVRIPDTLKDPEYESATMTIGAARSAIGVPLLRDGRVEGGLTIVRTEPGDFTPRQIELVQTFADQAVIAIENVRLFDQVQARTRELSQSLDELRAAQDRLVQTEKLASLGQLTAGIAHEIKNPLNFVNNFAALSRELIDEAKELIAKASVEAAAREEIDELVAMIDSNLDKVVHHGKRADAIVRNMLLHSREGSGERASLDVNALVEEGLNLAYHGARAERPSFDVTLKRQFDPKAGAIDGFSQELTRVLLNLVANGFYATQQRKNAETAAYEPTVTATTRDLGDAVQIVIRDNGAGIPDDVKAKMFNPFFTTKPAGEGTGLGLSLSHDIVVKQHGGTIEVATERGAFTEFVLTLPRRMAAKGT